MVQTFQRPPHKKNSRQKQQPRQQQHGKTSYSSQAHRTATPSHHKPLTQRAKPPAKKRAGSMAKRKPASLYKKRLRKIKWSRLFFTAVAATALGYLSSWLITVGVPKAFVQLRSSIFQITQTNAILPYGNKAYDDLSSQIGTYLKTQPGVFSVSGIDLTTSSSFGHNPNIEYSAGQTIALPVTMALYSDIAAHLISPRTEVTLKSSDEEPGPGFVGGMPVGTRFTVAQLAKAALVDGDVVATNMLIRKLGVDQINSFITGTGSTDVLSLPYLTTSYNLTLYLAYLHTMATAHPRSIAPLMADLLQVPAEGRIKSAITAGQTVYHVLGDWPKEFHDAAIIDTSGHPVVLAICSDGVTAAVAARVETHIARMVDQFEVHGVTTP